MKLLMFCLLFHPDTTEFVDEKDTTLFKRYLMNTAISVNFNFHHFIGHKQNLNEINTQNEYLLYQSYQSTGIDQEGYFNPEDLGYAHVGTFRFMAGFELSTTLPFKKYKPEVIYGINFSYEKREYQTSMQIRKEIIDLYSADLLSQGYSRPQYMVNDDTSLVRRRTDVLSFVIPVAFRFPVYKSIGIEGGAFIRFFGYAKYISSGASVNLFGNYTLLGIKPNPYLAICCKINKKFVIQAGVDFSKTVFVSFQI